MTALLTPPAPIVSLGDLLESLGGVSPKRVRFHPYPGTATVADVNTIERRENRLYELIDGTLVEKVMAFRESMIAVAISATLRAFVVPRKLGVVTGADGMMRIFPGMVRIPDVAFVSRHRLPGGRVPVDAVPPLVPDLAVEVLSEGNTAAEMTRKRRDYFDAGVRLVWLVDPAARNAVAYTAVDQSVLLDETQSLDGGTVLPGFSLPVRELFAELDL